MRVTKAEHQELRERSKPKREASLAAPAGSASIPEHGLDEVADTFNQLHSKLLTGDGLPPRPFWLRIGNTGYKITDENRDTIALGLIMCLDVRGHLSR